jgi:purine-nucleoside phosphorylase
MASRHERGEDLGMAELYAQLQEASGYVSEVAGRHHRIAVTLGSGLGDYADGLPEAITIPYADIPHFPVPTVAGHGGKLVSAVVGDTGVLILAGRVHYYEGRPLGDLVFGTRLAVVDGCDTVILTNAAGGCGDGLEPGDLVVLRDHINLTGQSPLIGPNDERLGPRFPDMSTVYAAELRARAHAAAAAAGTSVKEGVYAWFTGPAYETPAEVEMARRLGADLVGMSTVPEAVAARHLGADVLGISLVTNLAAGIGDHPLSHDEVTEAGRDAQHRFAALLDHLLRDLTNTTD